MKQDNIWDYFQDEGLASFEGNLSRLAYLVRKLKSGECVLNIGVGNGKFEELALQRGIDVHSMDPSHVAIERLRERLPLGDKARVGYAEAIPFADDQFDGVAVSEILEHLAPDTTQRVLSEIHRVLKLGGRVLGTVPAGEDLPASLVVCPDCGHHFHRWGHAQSFTCNSLKTTLRTRFATVTASARRFVPWNQVNWIGKTGGMLRIALNYCGIHQAGENIVFEAWKREDL